MKPFLVYILASKHNGALYTGSTDDLGKRVEQHKTKAIRGFTAQYGVDRLVWFEAHDSREAAFTRVRLIKEWKRKWKLDLIEQKNPNWDDLSEKLAL